MRRLHPVLLALALLGPAPAGEEERNLVANGGFEEGPPGASKIPGWTEADGLTTFFESEPGRGRVLRIDTDVLLTEADARWEEMALPAEERPPAKPKGPTTPPKYDTVGGTTGAKVYSDYLRVEPGMRYRLTVDVKSDAPAVMIFVKGYARFQGGYRKYYQCYKNIPAPEPGWHTCERTFNPTAKSPEVSHIRVMPYAFWPPGEAWIDDVRVTRVGPEQVEGAVSAESLLPNGGFERPLLAPWTAEGPAARVERGSDGACGRVDAGGALLSGLVPVEEDRPYRVRARVLPAGGVLTAAAEGLVRFGGKWVTLFTATETLPPAAEDWIDLELTVEPTKDTPQVTHLRVAFRVEAGKGSAFVDDVAVEPADPE